MNRFGQGSIFKFGKGVTAEFAFRIPQPDGHPLVWCSCPDFRCDDAWEHMNQIIDLEGA